MCAPHGAGIDPRKNARVPFRKSGGRPYSEVDRVTSSLGKTVSRSMAMAGGGSAVKASVLAGGAARDR
jgi:hypothetical protein